MNAIIRLLALLLCIQLGSSTDSVAPSLAPTRTPTIAPSQPTSRPSGQPTGQPTGRPTSSPSALYQPISVPLGVCVNFAVQAGTQVSFDGTLTTISTGNVGVAPGTSISGNYALTSGSTQDNSPLVIQCTADLNTAYGIVAGATCPPYNVLQSSNLAGITLRPGVYCSADGFFSFSASTLTLNGLNLHNP